MSPEDQPGREELMGNGKDEHDSGGRERARQILAEPETDATNACEVMPRRLASVVSPRQTVNFASS